MSNTAGGGIEGMGTPGNVLIQSPNGTNLGEMHAELDASPQTVIGVAYGKPIEEWLGAYQHLSRENMTVISVGEDVRSAAATTSSQPPAGLVPPGEPVIEGVNDVTNLTAIGEKLLGHLRANQDVLDDDELVVCFDSLSGLLHAVSLEHAFRFLHLLTKSISHYGATAHYHLDPTAHDPETIHTIQALFDTTIETQGSPHPEDWVIKSPYPK